MSKTVLIDEPFSLSNYTSSYRGKQKSPVSDHVFVHSVNSSRIKSLGTREGLVTVSTQADGVHLVDVSGLHSVVSHTLGPSTSFSCPAVTLEVDEDEYTTYVVIETSPDLSNAEEAGRVVWKWSDRLSDASEKQKETRTVLPPTERIHGLYPTSDNRILAVTRSARILLLDADLDEKAALSISANKPLDVYKIFVFSDSECSFGVSGSAATLVIASFDDSSSLNIHVASLNNDDISSALHARLSQKREVISDISCSASGTLSILCKDGGWGAFTISPTSSQLLRPLAQPIKLANISLEHTSIIALTSHHVLLAALPKSSSPSVVHIHIWDLQYTVMLASHTLPLPSSFLSSPPSLKLTLADSPVDPSNQSSIRGQVILTLSASSGTSTLLVVPYLVSRHSTLAAAIGRGPETKLWLQSEALETASKAKDDGGRKKLLADVKAAMDAGKVQVAENAFSVWLEEAEKKPGADSSSVLEHNFVKELLQLLLPPVGKTTPTHAPGIVKKLLERNGVVSSAMVQGGLLSALRARNDWPSIDIAFTSVVDLPEPDIIETLVALTKLHNAAQRSKPASGDAMQVDTPASAVTDELPLATYLARVVTYPNATSKGLVLGLKKFMRDPQDAMPIGQVIERWIKSTGQNRRAGTDPSVLPSHKDLVKNENGVFVVNTQKRLLKKVAKEGAAAKKQALPPLAKIVQFLQSFMDACFLLLLQHAPAHKLMQQLQTLLTEEMAFAEVLEQLRGSLEPYAVGHQKAIREAAIPEKEKERQRQKGDWRQRRNGAPSVVGAVGAIGVYQVEELVL